MKYFLKTLTHESKNNDLHVNSFISYEYKNSNYLALVDTMNGDWKKCLFHSELNFRWKMLGEVLLFVALSLIAFAFYKWATLNNDYFEKRNVKCTKPSFLFGNSGSLFLNKYTATEFAQKLYQAFPEEP